MPTKKQKQQKKPNFLVKVFRFFFPKNFKAELYKGMYQGQTMQQGISPKVVPTWWLGKGLRKLVDPKHKVKFGKEKDSNGQEK